MPDPAPDLTGPFSCGYSDNHLMRRVSLALSLLLFGYVNRIRYLRSHSANRSALAFTKPSIETRINWLEHVFEKRLSAGSDIGL